MGRDPDVERETGGEESSGQLSEKVVFIFHFDDKYAMFTPSWHR